MYTCILLGRQDVASQLKASLALLRRALMSFWVLLSLLTV